MDIVLVRHAQAEDGSAELDDLNRQLTQKGRQKFKRSISHLKRHLDPDKRVIVWTSPAARALQTSQLIADELKIKDITRYDWIYTGDSDAFGAAVKNADKKAFLFVVGHQPHLSLWAEQLSDIKVSFKKGAMACFALTASPKAELCWLIGATTQKDVSIQRRQVSINDFEQAMIGILLDVSKWRDRFLKKPNEAEPVHQLRVSLRQARSLLYFIKPVVDGQAYSSAQTELKASADKLSSIREIDVLLAQRRAFLSEKKPITGCKALAKLLKDRREMERSAINDYLSSDSFIAALSGISSWVKRWAQTDHDAAMFELFVLRRFEKWHQETEDALKDPDTDDHEKLHSLRIKLKNLHNVRESVRLPDECQWIALTQLKKLQRDLGEICDAYASMAFLRQMDAAFSTQQLEAEAGILTAYLQDLGVELKHKYLLTRDRLGELHA